MLTLFVRLFNKKVTKLYLLEFFQTLLVKMSKSAIYLLLAFSQVSRQDIGKTSILSVYGVTPQLSFRPTHGPSRGPSHGPSRGPSRGHS